MTRTRQMILLPALLLAAFCLPVQAADTSIQVSTNTLYLITPPKNPQPARSPVSFFRQLLAETPEERIQSLADRTPEVRARIRAKLREYQALPPDERELRLQSTDLRWYLMPLFHLPPANRADRLAQVPDELKGLVKTRLAQWDALPAGTQQEFLTNDMVMHYFANAVASGSSGNDPAQEKIAAQFNQFFELTPEEKQRALNTLSDVERSEMEKTLTAFGQLPPQQRRVCVRNYARFAGMSPAERAEFLKNADAWAKLSPAERQTWRNLVAIIPETPLMPQVKVPANIMPPAPHALGKLSPPGMATN